MSERRAATGPLTGVNVVELAGIGPGPHAAMLLSDLGAEVIRLDRPEAIEGSDPIVAEHSLNLVNRGRASVAIDLKKPAGVELALRLIARTDVLIDPFRPGVAERLGLGPDVCHEVNSGLVYGRMTGWGQAGPWANRAGHDINYLALAGALHGIGAADRPPVPPLNLVADFGGGGMLLAFGVVAALFERSRSGEGQVVDAAMVDGVASLLTAIIGFRAMGEWLDQRESNLLDGAAHFYRCYETRDAKYIAIGALEPKFYRQLLDRLGLDQQEWPQADRQRWPELGQRLAAVFAKRTQAEWAEVFDGTDVCFAPVLSLAESPHHPQMAARATYVEDNEILQPAPVPRFERTPGAIQGPPSTPGANTRTALLRWGLSRAELARLEGSGVVRQAP